MAKTSKANWYLFGSKAFVKSTTDRGKKQTFQDPVVVGAFVGYEITPGYGWSGIYWVWWLKDCVDIDLRQHYYAVSGRQILPFVVRELAKAEDMK